MTTPKNKQPRLVKTALGWYVCKDLLSVRHDLELRMDALQAHIYKLDFIIAAEAVVIIGLLISQVR